MRALAIALCISLIACLPLRADETHVFAPLSNRAAPISFRYDKDSLTADLVFELSRAQISIGMTNILQLPEHEPPGGVFLDEYTLLTDALNGIEVDIGNEPEFSLTFSVVW